MSHLSDASAAAAGANKRANARSVTFDDVRRSVDDVCAGRTVIPARRTATRLADIHQSYGSQVETEHGIFGKFTARMVTDLQGGDEEVASRRRFEWVIDSAAFQVLIASCIVASTIQMGLEADYPEQVGVWTACEYTFTVVFILEALAKGYVLRLAYITDPWHRFDGFLVVIAVLNLWVLDLIGGAMVPTWVWRLLRLSKLSRTLRLVRTFKRLFLVTIGVWEAMKATFWVALLLAVSIYAGAIFCVGVLGPRADGVDRYPGYSDDDEQINRQEIMQEFNPYLSFGTVPRAMLTLFNIALLTQWREVMGPVALFNPYMIAFFFAFMTFVTFGLMNVLVGLIVNEVIENSQKLAAEEQLLERQQKLQTIKRIQQLVADIDLDNDGRVSIDDFERSLADQDSPMSVQLGQVDLPLGFSPLELLSMLDSNGDGTLNHDEFVMSFYRLLDGGPFQHSCLVQMGINSLKFGQRVNEMRLERIESLVLELAKGLRSSGTLDEAAGPMRHSAWQGAAPGSLIGAGFGQILDRMSEDRRRTLTSREFWPSESSAGGVSVRAGSSVYTPNLADAADTLLRDSYASELSDETGPAEPCVKGGQRSSCHSITEEPEPAPLKEELAELAGWARKGVLRQRPHPALQLAPPHDEAEEDAECRAGLPANSPCLPGLPGTRRASSDSAPHKVTREWNC